MEARQITLETRLVLVHDGRRFDVPWGGEDEFLVGRAGCCDLIVARPFVSRVHARIRSDGQFFVLEDLSANGTFVRTEDERVRFVRRQRLRLWGVGHLCFGEPWGSGHSVRFEHRE